MRLALLALALAGCHHAPHVAKSRCSDVWVDAWIESQYLGSKEARSNDPAEREQFELARFIALDRAFSEEKFEVKYGMCEP